MVYAQKPQPVTADALAEIMPSALGLLSDEPEMESSLHAAQLFLLVSILEWLWRDKKDYFLGYNLTIYFSRDQLKHRDFRGPDLFLVKDVVQWARPSWVVWEEGGKYPNLIIELLSESTADVDRGLKKILYQDRFRTPEYFWFSPTTLEFQGWRLSGHEYHAIETTDQGWCWSEELELYLGVEARQLRYFHPTGELVPTPSEAAINERIRADQEKRRADQERHRAEQLAQQLRELGFDPNGE